MNTLPVTSIGTNNYFLVIAACAIAVVAVFVLSRNRKSLIHGAFFLFAIGGALWVAGISLLSLTHLFIFDKFVHYGGLLFVVGFFLLAQEFPKRKKIKVSPYLLYAPLFIDMFAIIPWNLVNQGMTIYPDGTITPIPGPALLFHSLLGLLYTGLGIYLLAKKFRHSEGRERSQIAYLFLGAGIFVTSGVIFDALLPAFNITAFNLLGPLSAFIFVSLIAYAILRHELLDIRVVIQRGLIYTIVFATIIGLYVVAINISSLFFERDSGVAFVGVGVFTTILGILAVPPFERYFRRKTDKFFFKDRYDYAEALHTLSEIVYTNIELSALTKKAEKALTDILKAEYVRITLPAKETLDESAEMAAERRAERHLPTLRIPIRFEGAAIGEIQAGIKRSGDHYTEEDMRLLETFAYQAATALSRARLYAEVKEHAQELENKVSERTRELREAQESQRRTMIDISHNLQTPLAIFQNKLEQLKKTLPRDTELLEFQKLIEDLSAFIYDLLTLARLEKEDRVPPTTLIDLSILLKEVCEEIEIIAEADDIKVTCSIAAGIHVRADEKRMREIVMNIVSNSIKYMRPGNEKEIVVSLSGEKNQAILSIADNGIGIGTEDLHRIFERFYRARIDSSVRGTGIGLAITKEIVERYGGTISSTSELGKGTTMTVRLPRAR